MVAATAAMDAAMAAPLVRAYEDLRGPDEERWEKHRRLLSTAFVVCLLSMLPFAGGSSSAEVANEGRIH